MSEIKKGDSVKFESFPVPWAEDLQIALTNCALQVEDINKSRSIALLRVPDGRLSDLGYYTRCLQVNIRYLRLADSEDIWI